MQRVEVQGLDVDNMALAASHTSYKGSAMCLINALCKVLH